MPLNEFCNLPSGQVPRLQKVNFFLFGYGASGFRFPPYVSLFFFYSAASGIETVFHTPKRDVRFLGYLFPSLTMYATQAPSLPLPFHVKTNVVIYTRVEMRNNLI